MEKCKQGYQFKKMFYSTNHLNNYYIIKNKFGDYSVWSIRHNRLLTPYKGVYRLTNDNSTKTLSIGKKALMNIWFNNYSTINFEKCPHCEFLNKEKGK